MSRRFRLSLVPFLTMLAASCSSTPDNGVEVIEPEVQDVSRPLSELAKIPVFTEAVGARGHEAEPARALPRMRKDDGARLRAAGEDPVVQTALGTGQIPTPAANFEGMGTGLSGFTVNSAPPDTDGDIGPNHYVQVVNTGLTVFSRTGAKLLGPVNTNTLWSGFSGACATTNDGDATIRYDRIADRWVVAQFSVNGGNGPFYQCIAVSTTPDPTGSYNRYQFNYSAFNDYPKMGLWPDAYYVTFNMFSAGTFSFLGGKACAFDRVKMVAGAAATMQCFDTGVNYGGLLPSDLDGPTPPPAGTPNYFVALDTTSTLAFWKFHVDFTTPASSSFTGPVSIPVSAYSVLCGSSGTCVKQPSTTNTLDALSDRLMNRVVYRNFFDHEALLLTHAVVAGTSGGVRFYELRSPGSATPTVFQQGTYAPDANYRWMSSAAFDSVGNIALGFTISSSTISPSVRYTGRLASDPLGTMGQGEATLIAGTGSQTGGLTRWGDYSAMNIDPVDDCTFWYTQEYMSATGSFNWRTRVGSFKFANCGTPGDDFTITPSPTTQTVISGQSTTYQIATTVLSGNAQAISLSVTGLPTGVTGSFSPATVTAGQTSTLTLTAAVSAPTATAQFMIVGTGPAATHSATATVNVQNNNVAPTVSITAPATGATVSGTVTVTATAADSDGTVTGVKFDFPDGTSVTDTTAPYSATWNSATVPDGASYAIRATATDNASATTTATVGVNVANGGASCINGTFTATGLPQPIPDNSTVGVTSTLSVMGTGKVGALYLSLNIAHPYRGDLVVTLTSPGGTSFVVSNRAGGSADDIVLTDQPITTFNNQTAAGTWKLVVQDLATVDTGTLNSWSLKIVGNCGVTTHWSGSASPNLPTIDNGTACTSLMVSTSGDASAAKLDISGRHDWRSILRGTLAHNGVTVDAFPVNTFVAGPGTFSFTNRAASGISGDASGMWTLCIVDTDAYGDTGILSTWSVHD
jgi:subtilisin-like proprotein convertase family protein